MPLQGNMSRFYEARDLINQIPQTGSGGQYQRQHCRYISSRPISSRSRGVGDAADQFLHPYDG